MTLLQTLRILSLKRMPLAQHLLPCCAYCSNGCNLIPTFAGGFGSKERAPHMSSRISFHAPLGVCSILHSRQPTNRQNTCFPGELENSCCKSKAMHVNKAFPKLRGRQHLFLFPFIVCLPPRCC